MSEFSTSIKKLRTIWERVQKNINDIKDKDNIDEFEFFVDLLKQQNIKVPIQIFDSLTFNKSPVPFTDAFTAIKGEKMPSLVSYSENIDINLPEALLPFVKYSIEVTPLPNTEVHGVFEYDPSTWSGDNIEVRGGGTLIWKGASIVDTNILLTFITHDEDSLISKGISLGLTKETWDADIDVDPPIGGFDKIAGKVTLISGTKITGSTCLTTENTQVFSINHLTNKDHKIIELTNDGFTGIGDEAIITFTPDGNGGCDKNTVVNTNVTKSFQFADLDDFLFLIDTPSTQVTVGKGSIVNKEFTKGNRWLFYSTELQKIFVSKNIGIDGDFQKIQLSNLPNTNDGDILPYTNITLKRNLNGINDPPTIQKQSDGSFPGLLGNTLTSIARTGREFKNYLKTSPSTADNDTYRFRLEGSFIITSPSIILSDDSVQFPVYDDSYTIVDTTYDLTTEDHTILSKNIWIPETQTVILNIKAYLVSPLYWREERKYKK